MLKKNVCVCVCIDIDRYIMCVCMQHFTEAYEAYIKEQEITYKTEVTTTVGQEPRVAVVPPVGEMEQEQILIQRRMAQQAQMMQSFTSEQVS